MSILFPNENEQPLFHTIVTPVYVCEGSHVIVPSDRQKINNHLDLTHSFMPCGH